MYYSSLGQMFGEPSYGMLLPPGYQFDGQYPANGEIYRDPNFRSYSVRGKWNQLYAGMLPAGVTPRTSLQIYGRGELGTQWWRLKYANEGNIADVKATLNKEIMDKYQNKIDSQIKLLTDVENQPGVKKSELATRAIQNKKQALRKELKAAKKEGKKLIKKQEAQYRLDDKKSITGGEVDVVSMYGLGLRPDYRIVQPPAMQGKLMDIVGQDSLGEIAPPIKFGGILALAAIGGFLIARKIL